MMDWMNPCGGMMIMMIVGLILAVIGIVALIKWISGKANQNTNDSALDILRDRYARGEISEKEFEERKKNLNN